MEYLNFYNNEEENATILFKFDEIKKEEALRLQAYLLKDNTFFVVDEDSLDKISEENRISSSKKISTIGEISLEKDPTDLNNIILSGTIITIDSSNQKHNYEISGSIFEGLNFVAITASKQDIQTSEHEFLSVNWCYEKSYKEDKLIRNDIKTPSTWIASEPDCDVIEYTVSDGFNIKENPTEVFKENKKTPKVKRK